MPYQFDLLIRGAMLLDGSGRPGWQADLAVAAGKIVAIGDLSAPDVRAATELNAHGLVLAPGFIDVHTHDDLEVLRNPQLLAKLSQGVTTVITGNCGISAAPVTLRSAIVPDPMNLLGQSVDFSYPAFADYAAAVDAAQPAVNVAALVGHTALRASAMDRLDRKHTARCLHHRRIAKKLRQPCRIERRRHDEYLEVGPQSRSRIERQSQGQIAIEHTLDAFQNSIVGLLHIRADQDNNEFIATLADRDVILADIFPDAVGKDTQGFIPHIVAITFVEFSKIIEIDKQQCEVSFTLRITTLEHPVFQIIEQAAVMKSG